MYFLTFLGLWTQNSYKNYQLLYKIIVRIMVSWKLATLAPFSLILIMYNCVMKVLFLISMFGDETYAGINSVGVGVGKSHIAIMGIMFQWWIALVALIVLFIVLGAGIIVLKSRIAHEKEKARNKIFKKVFRMKLKSLQSQLNPHFTFNALNSIQSYILEGNTEAALDYLSDFSIVLRKNLDNATREIIPLSHELDYIKHYIKLEQMRFPDQFDFEISVDPGINLMKVQIVPMIIQPFLEDAIRHGLTGKTRKGMLKMLFVLKGENALKCVIENNGIINLSGVNGERTYGSNSRDNAIYLTRERIKLLNHIIQNGVRYELKISSLLSVENEPCGTRVTLIMPLNDLQ